jgi:hypothetical protein
MRVMLFKLFESSVCAFRETIAKMLMVHQRFLDALERGFVPAGVEAQNLVYEEYNQAEEQDLLDTAFFLSSFTNANNIGGFLVFLIRSHPDLI